MKKLPGNWHIQLASLSQGPFLLLTTIYQRNLSLVTNSALCPQRVSVGVWGVSSKCNKWETVNYIKNWDPPLSRKQIFSQQLELLNTVFIRFQCTRQTILFLKIYYAGTVWYKPEPSCQNLKINSTKELPVTHKMEKKYISFYLT
jgi:hypothetical protein